MDMYPRYKSKFGYQIGNDQIDSYGVNHSGFTTQDEVAYQFAREEKENALLEQLKKQGITSNFPQYGTNFWGDSANNYGFGMTNISHNIENMSSPTPQTTTVPPQPVQPKYWETAQEGKQVYENVVRNEGNYQPQEQNILKYGNSAIKAIPNMINNYMNLKNANLTDKYKHAFMNCNAAQYGKGGEDIAKLASNAREFYDIKTGSNTIDTSQGDNYANLIGRLLGRKYPNGDCNELIQKYIKKYW